MCVCVCASQIGRQAVLTRVWIVCAQRCDIRWESCSSNNVLLGTGTISALCGRTVALLLKSQASSNPLFYWQTIQQRVHTIWWSKYDFYGHRHTIQISLLLPVTAMHRTLSWMHSNLSNIWPKKKNCTDKLTWKYFVLLALIPVSISCVMDLPVMSAHSDLIQTDRSPYYHLLLAQSWALGSGTTKYRSR